MQVRHTPAYTPSVTSDCILSLGNNIPKGFQIKQFLGPTTANRPQPVVDDPTLPSSSRTPSYQLTPPPDQHPLPPPNPDDRPLPRPKPIPWENEVSGYGKPASTDRPPKPPSTSTRGTAKPPSRQGSAVPISIDLKGKGRATPMEGTTPEELEQLEVLRGQISSLEGERQSEADRRKAIVVSSCPVCYPPVPYAASLSHPSL